MSVQPERQRSSRSNIDPDELSIQLLGGFRVAIGFRVIGGAEWPLRKAASLLKLLALSPGHRLHREQVLEILWPDVDPEAATNSFHRTLHALRRTLGLHSGSTQLRLWDDVLSLGAAGTLWIDVDAFEAAVATARRSRHPAAYHAALELYVGDLLPDDRYEDWSVGRREELRGLYLGMLLELSRLYEQRGEYNRAIEALSKAVASEPAHEEAHVGLMRLYALSGQRTQAVIPSLCEGGGD